MTGVPITGCGVLTAAGEGPAALAAPAVAAAGAPAVRVDVTGLYEDLPRPTASAIAGFDVRATLGRKGTSFFDRATALAIVACGHAVRDAGLDLETADPARIGLVLGTTTGSLGSTMDYSRETLVQDRPYLVNPVLFPNTVMNCASGQAAIWYGFKGVNATVAGGPLAFLQSLRYAMNALDRGFADTILVGAVEEFTPQAAWAAELAGARPAGEAAAVFVLDRHARADGPALGEVLAVTTGFSPTGGPSVTETLAGCVRRALARANVSADEVGAMATGDLPGETAESDAVTTVLGRPVAHLGVGDALGDCRAATQAVALARVLAEHRCGDAPDGGLTVITGRGADGAVTAALVRGWRDAGTHRG